MLCTRRAGGALFLKAGCVFENSALWRRGAHKGQDVPALLACLSPQSMLAQSAKPAMQLPPHAQPLPSTCLPARAGGVKLHAELAYLLGSCSNAVLSTGASFYLAAGPQLLPASISFLAALGATLGLVPAFAALSDLLVLLLWPLGVLYVGLARLWRLQLTYLRLTWGLMRGNHQVGWAQWCARGGRVMGWVHIRVG